MTNAAAPTSAQPGAQPQTGAKRIELTGRALVLGCLLTLVFTAANVYLGLRVGLTFASAIPAAVISMALLRAFRTSTIWENMTVQTVASVGGAMSSIIFVLPALVMVGWWTGFPFWQSFLICTFGGVLGVTFSIPLRRALVINAQLPYPEGVAAAEVLKVGSRGADQTEAAVRENKAGLLTVIVGSVVSALFAFLAAARVFVAEAAVFFRLPTALGGGATGIGGGLSLALLGAGHLVGLAVGLAMLAGVVIAWGVAVPVMTAMQHVQGAAEDVATTLWAKQVRFIGAGAIGVAAIWTLIKLIGPLVGGVTSALAAQRKRASHQVLDITEQDIPIGLVGILSLVVLVAIAVLLWSFTQGSPLAMQAPALIAGGLIYVVVIGFIVAAVCGYMAGLIGSSNSPVSGVGILAIITAALLMLGAMKLLSIPADPAIIAFALMMTAIVFSISVISNDNLQDLKTGQLVGATPWRQQTALIVGVIAGSLVIPPILDLLNGAYGFTGGPPPSVVGAKPLPAPQATLISALASGVIDGNLRWDLIGLGAGLGVVLVIVDEIMVRASGGKLKAPPLAVAMGIYLPIATTIAVVVGAVAGKIYDDVVAKTSYAAIAKRMGVLLASGMIVGESLFGVFTAAVIVSTQNAEPFGIVPADSAWPAMIVGVIAFAVVVVALYAWTRKQSELASHQSAEGAVPQSGTPTPLRAPPGPAGQVVGSKSDTVRPVRNGIFISYRRADTEQIAGRIYDRLVHEFGNQSVFFDVDSVPIGIDFAQHIRQHLEKSGIVVLIIGRNWIGKDANGGKRIDDVADWSRLEIEIALQLGARIVPVLVGDATMPHSSELPSSIATIATLNAAQVSAGRDFEVHVSRLIAAIRTLRR